LVDNLIAGPHDGEVLASSGRLAVT
jgi:hypothetical protein